MENETVCLSTVPLVPVGEYTEHSVTLMKYVCARATYIHMHARVRTYVRTYIHTYLHTYVHTYIHTYIHTVSIENFKG